MELDSAAAGREPERARIVVEKLGFTAGKPSRGVASVAFGLELVNTSYEHDAIGVDVTWRFVDARGRSLARGATSLTGVPASTTFYVGGRVGLAADAHIARLSTAVRVRASGGRRLFLPVAANLDLSRNRSGRLRVSGALTNAYDRRLSDAARLYAVIFDGRGRIVGGGAATVEEAAVTTALAPGETGAFAFEAFSPTPRQTLFAGVSIDP